MNLLDLQQKDLSLEAKYEQLTPLLDSLIDRDDHIISVLGNTSAFLKQSFEKMSWVGFYIFENGRLYLGPFQGKVACTSISPGKGVCGKAAAECKTVIVTDVEQFPGHIVCDSGSKSEIVVPIMSNEKVWGVLDIDSYEKTAFNNIDKKYLERFCQTLVRIMHL